jgi:hypothetical protein
MLRPRFPEHTATLRRVGKKAVEGRTDVEFVDVYEGFDTRNFGVGFCSPKTRDNVKRFPVNKIRMDDLPATPRGEERLQKEICQFVEDNFPRE